MKNFLKRFLVDFLISFACCLVLNFGIHSIQRSTVDSHEVPQAFNPDELTEQLSEVTIDQPSVGYVNFRGEEITIGEFEAIAIEIVKEQYGISY